MRHVAFDERASRDDRTTTYDSVMPAPGFGPFGFGISALIAGVVVGAHGHTVGGLALDALGAVLVWSAVLR